MIPEDKVQTYWDHRAKQLGRMAVGYGDQNSDKQDKYYAQRTEFIFSHLSRKINVLEYGCGIGRYAKEFQSGYLGIDISADLLSIAIKENPNKIFAFLSQPYLSVNFHELSFNADMVFFATVLQHCNDDLVRKIFRSVRHYQRNKNISPLIIALYENSEAFEKSHIKGRPSLEYMSILENTGFKINDGQHFSKSHRVKGELHTLTVAVTKNE